METLTATNETETLGNVLTKAVEKLNGGSLKQKKLAKTLETFKSFALFVKMHERELNEMYNAEGLERKKIEEEMLNTRWLRESYRLELIQLIANL